MKNLDNYIIEKLHINKNVNTYKYFPGTKEQLIFCIKNKIDREGLGTENKPLNLNDIDTSEITDMSNLFNGYAGELHELANNGHFDISCWNVSNVENMTAMFAFSSFDGDISKWKVNKVTNMGSLFYDSTFSGKNGDISKWDVSKVNYMKHIFIGCPLETNPPKWYKR